MMHYSDTMHSSYGLEHKDSCHRKLTQTQTQKEMVKAQPHSVLVANGFKVVQRQQAMVKVNLIAVPNIPCTNNWNVGSGDKRRCFDPLLTIIRLNTAMEKLLLLKAFQSAVDDDNPRNTRAFHELSQLLLPTFYVGRS